MTITALSSHHLTLDATCAGMAYNAMRGAPRMAFLRLQAHHLESGIQANADQLAALLNICELADCSESLAVRNLSRRLRMAVRDAEVRASEQAAQEDAASRQAIMQDRAEPGEHASEGMPALPSACDGMDDDELEACRRAEDRASLPDNHLEAQAEREPSYLLPEDEADAAPVDPLARDAGPGEEAAAAEFMRISSEQEQPSMAEVLDGQTRSLDQTSAWITNAPAAYDGFGTWTEQNGPDGQRTVRIHADHLEWQARRYWSGGFGCTRHQRTSDAAAAAMMQMDRASEAAQMEQAQAALVAEGCTVGTLDQAQQEAHADRILAAADAASSALPMPRLEVLVLQAVAQHRRRCFLDSVALPEARAVDILAALDALAARGMVEQQASGTGLHTVMLAPAFADRIDAGLEALPEVQSEQPRQRRASLPRQPRRAASGCTAWSIRAKGRDGILRACDGGWRFDGEDQVHATRSAAAQAFTGCATATATRFAPLETQA